ncbi:MAG: nuclear transport factor 2 family protein [Porticoccaceae bacterium]
MTTIDTKAMQALLDKQAITEVLMRYSRSIDRKDPQLLSSLYWPEATDDHLIYDGDIPGLVDFCMEFTVGMATHHFLGNVLIEVADDSNAYSETYYQAYHNMDAEGGGKEDFTLLGRYLDHFQKRNGEWKMLQRTVAVDAYTKVPATSHWESGILAEVKTRGAPRPQDPLYRLNPLALNNVEKDNV